MANCNKDHGFASEHVRWADMDESQASEWRHKCAACAYEQGFSNGIDAALDKISQLLIDEVEDLHPQNNG